MQLNKRQILIIFLSHFFIIFGIAHAGACIGLIEFIYFPYFDKQNFSLLIKNETNTYLPAVGLFGLLGNISLIFCTLVKQNALKATLYISGVFFYFLSIVYLASSENVQFSFIFCIPLLLTIVYNIIKPYVVSYNGWFKN